MERSDGTGDTTATGEPGAPRPEPVEAVVGELLELVPGLRRTDLEFHDVERDGTRFCEIRIPEPLWNRAVEETAVPEIERSLELEEVWLARGVEMERADLDAVGFQFPVEDPVREAE